MFYFFDALVANSIVNAQNGIG